MPRGHGPGIVTASSECPCLMVLEWSTVTDLTVNSRPRPTKGGGRRGQGQGQLACRRPRWLVAGWSVTTSTSLLMTIMLRAGFHRGQAPLPPSLYLAKWRSLAYFLYSGTRDWPSFFKESNECEACHNALLMLVRAEFLSLLFLIVVALIGQLVF